MKQIILSALVLSAFADGSRPTPESEDILEITLPDQGPIEFKCQDKIGGPDACLMSCGDFTCSCRDGWFTWSCTCADVTLGGAAEPATVDGWGGVCMTVPEPSLPIADKVVEALEGNVCRVIDAHMVGACALECSFGGDLGVKVRAICGPTGLGDSACKVGDDTLIVDGDPCQ